MFSSGGEELHVLGIEFPAQWAGIVEIPFDLVLFASGEFGFQFREMLDSQFGKLGLLMTWHDLLFRRIVWRRGFTRQRHKLHDLFVRHVLEARFVELVRE